MKCFLGLVCGMNAGACEFSVVSGAMLFLSLTVNATRKRCCQWKMNLTVVVSENVVVSE